MSQFFFQESKLHCTFICFFFVSKNCEITYETPYNNNNNNNNNKTQNQHIFTIKYYSVEVSLCQYSTQSILEHSVSVSPELCSGIDRGNNLALSISTQSEHLFIFQQCLSGRMAK